MDNHYHIQETDASSNSNNNDNDNFVLPPGTCAPNINAPPKPSKENVPHITVNFPVENQNTTN